MPEKSNIKRYSFGQFFSKRLLYAFVVLIFTRTAPVLAQSISASASAQIQALLQEKAARGAAEQKVDSQILYNAVLAVGQAVANGAAPALRAGAIETSNGLVHVDIKANVSQNLLNAITAGGGSVESAFAQSQAVRAWIPLQFATTLAARADVLFIRPADRYVTSSGRMPASRPPFSVRQANVRAQLAQALPALAARNVVQNASAVLNTISDTSGVKAHGADIVQALGITGTGVKIGVMSDGVTSLATEQGAGRLPAVTIIPGQGNQGPGPCPGSHCPDEGTAMLEIVYSMAPGAQLYFATAEGGQTQFATNIQALRTAGCDIIVDDVTYFAEPVFQDGTVARAVNLVTGNGAMYFSSAANSGNKDSNTSGTWEGDFSDGGGVTFPEGGRIHSFGAHNYDVLTSPSPFGVYNLQWSDPFGGSCNDYDFFILDSAGTNVLGSSTNPQSCSQDPFEQIYNPSIPAGSLIVVVKYGNNSQPRALHIDTERGRLSVNTDGATFGHNAAASAFTLAAASVVSAGGGIFVGGTTNPPEAFSSDGPRKIFYDPTGNPITPNNFLFGTAGGTTLSKVDFTAADGGPSGVPGFNPFYGTSAAAPHAAAIAALIKSATPGLTNAQVKSALISTALHVTAPSGVGARTVGAGIIMANLGVNGVLPSLSIMKSHTGNFTQGQTGATYTITVSNSGTASTSGTTTVVDTLPSGLTATAMTGNGWNCTLATLTCTSTDVVAAANNFPAITLTVNVSNTAPSSVTNSATASGGGAPNSPIANDPTTIMPMVAGPAITINKSHTGNFTQGQVGATYTITIGNIGAASTSGTATVVDTLPSGLTATAISGNGWNCTLGTLTCTSTGVVAGNGTYPSITLTVNVSPTAPASVTNSAMVSGGGDATSHTANDPTTINPGAPSLSIAKTHPGDFVQGFPGNYLITVSNIGTVPTNGTIQVVDTLPAGLTAVSMAVTGWNCVLATLTCTTTAVANAGATLPAINLLVNVDPNAPDTLINSAKASGGGAANSPVATDTTNILSLYLYELLLLFGA